jgi:hypothetical protein
MACVDVGAKVAVKAELAKVGDALRDALYATSPIDDLVAGIELRDVSPVPAFAALKADRDDAVLGMLLAASEKADIVFSPAPDPVCTGAVVRALDVAGAAPEELSVLRLFTLLASLILVFAQSDTAAVPKLTRASFPRAFQSML